jgi:hypothetical protein
VKQTPAEVFYLPTLLIHAGNVDLGDELKDRRLIRIL